MTNRKKKEKRTRPARSPAKRNGKKDKDGHVFLSGLKNFGIIFALCLVIFGLLASVAVTLVTSTVDDIFDEQNHLDEIFNKDSEQTSANTDDPDAPAGESFSALVAVTDFDPAHYEYYPQGEALSELRLNSDDRDVGILGAGYRTVGVKMLALVRCDKERREYTITPFSVHTRVFTAHGYMQLGEVYSDFGPQFLVDKVEALSGIGIDYYFFLNAREAGVLAEALGPFDVELSQDIYSDGAAFGTVNRTYDSVTTVIPPELILPETDSRDTDKPEDTQTASPSDTSEDTQTDESDDEEDIREPRTTYSIVVHAGKVTVTGDNLQALLMFDDYENGVDERLNLDFQLVRGALLRLAGMSEEERSRLYEEVFLETPIIDCSVIYEEKKEDDPDSSGDADGDEKKKVIHGIFDDGKVNTDMSAKTAGLKGELIEAALKFEVKELKFGGRYVNGFFMPSLTDTASAFFGYKLTADPEKMITVTQD